MEDKIKEILIESVNFIQDYADGGNKATLIVSRIDSALEQLNQPKESESVEDAKKFLDNKSTYGICKEDGDYIHKDCVIDLLTEYATQHKEKEVSYVITAEDMIRKLGLEQPKAKEVSDEQAK